jgi:hypothetical protein
VEFFKPPLRNMAISSTTPFKQIQGRPILVRHPVFPAAIELAFAVPVRWESVLGAQIALLQSVGMVRSSGGMDRRVSALSL